MADELRARAGGHTASLAMRTQAEAGRVRVSLSLRAPPPEGVPPGAVTPGLGLGLARRIAELHQGTFDDSNVELTLVVPRG